MRTLVNIMANPLKTPAPQLNNDSIESEGNSKNAEKKLKIKKL